MLLWVSATLIFRVFGQYFLDANNPWLTLITFLLAVPVILAATIPYYHFRMIPLSKRLSSAVLIALPGMILDIFSVIYFDVAFPNLQPVSQPLFASWLLWAYSLILISGLPIKLNNHHDLNKTP
ncbi:DUF5367 family protein [Heyndrickxia sp. MSNUG]|uniref:DUF5367 family protein n=1 Tax=Heyndrickxia sp. MSNUG TaxID=3136677 RepID=UPI003C2F29C8